MKRSWLVPLFIFSLSSFAFRNHANAQHSHMEYNKIASECCFLDWGHTGWFAPGSSFPQGNLYSLKQNKFVRIQDLIQEKPIVIQLGSITCPAYDLNISKTKELSEKYKGKVDFYTLYVRENHPTEKFKPHSNFQQKIEYARQLQKEDQIGHDILIDEIEGTLHSQIGKFGNSTYLIGKDGKIAHWSIFTEPQLLEAGISELLKNQGLAAQVKNIKGTDIHPLAFEQYTEKEKMTTILKMKSRMTQADLRDATTEIRNLEKIPAYQKLDSDTKKSLHHYLRTMRDKTQTASTRGEAMKAFQVKLRGEYKRRFQELKKKNPHQSMEAFRTQIQ